MSLQSYFLHRMHIGASDIHIKHKILTGFEKKSLCIDKMFVDFRGCPIFLCKTVFYV